MTMSDPLDRYNDPLGFLARFVGRYGVHASSSENMDALEALSQVKQKLAETDESLAHAEWALEMIANRTHPATYLGESRDGTKLYGGSGDAAEFAAGELDAIREKTEDEGAK